MRDLIGGLDADAFENTAGDQLFAEFGLELRRVFDFGSGCGRLARQFLQQREPPDRYVGLDIHKGMVKWCQNNLAPHGPQFAFCHHDVAHETFNPGRRKPPVARFPVVDNEFDSALAISVFTHIIEDHAPFYLSEVARILQPGGSLLSTWFLFDKVNFPMLQSFQNSLYINATDITNAVIFDRVWLRTAAGEAGLLLTDARPPDIHGFHWWLVFTKTDDRTREVPLPVDNAPIGSSPPPVGPAAPSAVN